MVVFPRYKCLKLQVLYLHRLIDIQVLIEVLYYEQRILELFQFIFYGEMSVSNITV